MKKEMILTTLLAVGLSFTSFASTGSEDDGYVYFLVIIGVLFIVLLLLYGVDYLQKNGKTTLCKSLSFFNKKLNMLQDFLHKLKTGYFKLSHL